MHLTFTNYVYYINTFRDMPSINNALILQIMRTVLTHFGICLPQECSRAVNAFTFTNYVYCIDTFRNMPSRIKDYVLEKMTFSASVSIWPL